MSSLLDRYVATFASKDITAITALHAADGTFWLHVGEQPVRGVQAIGERFAAVFELWPDLRFVTRRTLLGDHFWVLDWTIVLPPADRRRPAAEIDCLDVVTVNADGLVVRKDTYVDAGQLAPAR